ncbi:MAG TPA: hypothetical protein VF719_07315, partial [Abditibacteriaceae bacterium]
MNTQKPLAMAMLLGSLAMSSSIARAAVPLATSQTVSPREDAAMLITLTGSDPTSRPLIYKIKTLPTRGNLYDGPGTTKLITAASLPYTLTTGNKNQVNYVPNANVFGADNFTFKSYNGTSDSVTATETLNVLAVAEAPSISSTVTKQETRSNNGLVITRNPIDGAEVTHFKITAITNGKLFQRDGVTQINDGDFITLDQGANNYNGSGYSGLRFTPAVGKNTPAGDIFSFVAQGATDNVGGGGGVGDGTTASITATAVRSELIVTSLLGYSTGQCTVSDCSLPAALQFIQSGDAGGSPIIKFKSGLAGTILLSSPLYIYQSVSIIGPANKSISISGQNSGQILNISQGTVAIANLSLVDGKGSAGSQGQDAYYYYNPAYAGSVGTSVLDVGNANLTLSNCTLANNSGGNGGRGGNGYDYNYNNQQRGAAGGEGGSALRVQSNGSATLTNCTLANNSGGKGGQGGLG